ncbi:MAG: hypothetical protein J0L73_06150 [Verrucomicrobia bacterium]|nr:hypothetical protein [Verrucomicrobiota bacterium]
MMRLLRYELIICALISLSGCQIYKHGEGLRFFWEPKFQEYSHTVEHRRGDGTILRGQHLYCATPSMSGNTLETAVIMGCYNMISGGDDEEHLLKMRFPTSTWEPYKKGPEIVKSEHRYYHVYHVTDPDGKTHLFWINASSYHDLF